jgi:hypothetical protein
LLRVNKWNSSLKKGLAQSVFKREKNHNLRLRRKLRWLKKRGFRSSIGRFVKFIRHYYKAKSKITRFISMKDKWEKDKRDKENKKSEEKDNLKENVTAPHQMIFLSKKHPSWINYTISRRIQLISLNHSNRKLKKKNFNERNSIKHLTNHNVLNKDTRPLCYASFIYGTRSSHFIRWQQFNKNARTRLFYNKNFKGGRVSDKLNFFELELEFIQSIYESYSGYTRS